MYLVDLSFYPFNKIKRTNSVVTLTLTQIFNFFYILF